MDRDDRVALVTGASSGFGWETALLLAKSGFKVKALARRLDRLEELAALQPGIEPLSLDLTNTRQLERFGREISHWPQPVSVLVNNAGYGVRGFVEEVPLEAVRRMFEVNVFAACRITQFCLPAMRQAREGWIFNISSVVGKFVWPGGGYYAATKHALEAITDALRHETAPFGIKVVSIRPGPFPTEFTETASIMSSGWPDGGIEGYAPIKSKTTDFFARVTQNSDGPGPKVVADLILEIMKNNNPLPGYGVGPMSDDFLVERMTGDEAGWRDLVNREIGIKGLKL